MYWITYCGVEDVGEANVVGLQNSTVSSTVMHNLDHGKKRCKEQRIFLFYNKTPRSIFAVSQTDDIFQKTSKPKPADFGNYNHCLSLLLAQWIKPKL